MASNKYLLQQEIIDYPGKKLPVVFCIDISGSMSIVMKGSSSGIRTGNTYERDGMVLYEVTDGTSRMEALNERLQDFHKQMVDDPDASVACQTCYVTFADNAEVVDDFALVVNKEVPEFEATGDKTYIVPALELCLKTLDSQMQYLFDEGIGRYSPWLVIFTDGLAHDSNEEIQRIKQELKKRELAKKLTVYTMALDDSDELYEQIRHYSIHKPVKYDQKNLSDFFNFLKQSISRISSNKINGEIEGFTEIDDSGDLV